MDTPADRSARRPPPPRSVIGVTHPCRKDTIYFPALLLIERLWLLGSKAAIRAILTPNSLDVYLGAAEPTSNGIEVAVDPQLASRNPTDEALQRIAWLVQSSEARTSWRSVLTNAYQDRLDLTPPMIALTGWIWGVELRSGFMACEIMSMHPQLQLTEPPPRIRIGKKLHRVPIKRAAEKSPYFSEEQWTP